MPKRQLAHVAGLAPVSHEGLSRIIEGLRDDVPASSSRRSIGRAIDATLFTDSPYGPVIQALQLPRIRGGDFSWSCCHPGAMLTLVCNHCVAFETMLRRLLIEKPSSPTTPWHVIFYGDECTVGDLLRVDHTREAWNFYWAFEEMPQEILAHENNWLLLGVMRTRIAQSLQGNVSAVLNMCFGN